LTPVDPNVNYRIGRYESKSQKTKHQDQSDSKKSASNEARKYYRGGSLFDFKKENEEEDYAAV